jgi:glutamate synthase domain-containing protein 3
MTGGTIVVLGPVGANFGAGMTGGRAYLYDPEGHHVAALHRGSVGARRLADVVAARADGLDRLAEFRRLVEGQRDAGSALAAMITLADPHDDDVWLVEPHAAADSAGVREAAYEGRAPAASSSVLTPLRNHPAIGLPPTGSAAARTVRP